MRGDVRGIGDTRVRSSVWSDTNNIAHRILIEYVKDKRVHK